MLIDHRNLGPVGDQLGDGGQATVHTLPGQDWRYKRYKPEAVIDSAQLDALIALPHKADAVDRDLFATATCWPQARVVDGSRTCGVLLPAIDPAFQCRLALGEGDLRLRTLDYLVRGELAAGYGLPDPALGERLAFAVRLARIAELFARHDVVYGDWSYDNTLWAPAGAVLMIDCDAATIGAVSTPRVETTAWDDPLTPAGATVDEFTDRYRLGLMIWRILERSPRHPTGPPWLPSAPKPVAAELDQLVAATFDIHGRSARQRRPRPDTWLAALQRAHTAAAVENRTVRPVATRPPATTTTAGSHRSLRPLPTTTTTTATVTTTAATTPAGAAPLRRPTRPLPTAAPAQPAATASPTPTATPGRRGPTRPAWRTVVRVAVTAAMVVLLFAAVVDARADAAAAVVWATPAAPVMGHSSSDLSTWEGCLR